MLADMVCIMSHGKIIALDTPTGIKRDQGFGYNLIIESVMSQSQISEYQRAKFSNLVLIDSGIPNCTFDHENSSKTKLIFMVPFEFDKRMSFLLKKLEAYTDILVSLEMTTLEDAYVKIVKALTPGDQKCYDNTKTKESIDAYRSTEGQSSWFKQFWGMFCRRLIVFVRERRQWFLTLSPFINIIMPMLIVYGFYGMHTNGFKD